MRIETTDIVLAAMLRSKGFPLERIFKQRNKGVFMFAEIPPELITEFGLGRVLVEPNTFNNFIKSLTQAVRQQPIEESTSRTYGNQPDTSGKQSGEQALTDGQ